MTGKIKSYVKKIFVRSEYESTPYDDLFYMSCNRCNGYLSLSRDHPPFESPSLDVHNNNLCRYLLNEPFRSDCMGCFIMKRYIARLGMFTLVCCFLDKTNDIHDHNRNKMIFYTKSDLTPNCFSACSFNYYMKWHIGEDFKDAVRYLDEGWHQRNFIV